MAHPATPVLGTPASPLLRVVALPPAPETHPHRAALGVLHGAYTSAVVRRLPTVPPPAGTPSWLWRRQTRLDALAHSYHTLLALG